MAKTTPSTTRRSSTLTDATGLSTEAETQASVAPGVDLTPGSDLSEGETELSATLPAICNRIHLVDGEKGGVGKTLMAQVMVQWFIDHDIKFRAAEADRSNTELLNTYAPYTSLVMVSENERLAGKTDGLFQMAAQHPVIVDLPAQAFRPMTDWIERNDLINAGAKHGIGMVKWFLCSGSVISLKLFEQTLTYFDGAIPHVLVRNLFLRDDWSAIEQNSQFQSLIEQYQVSVIDLPKLGYDERDLLDEHRLSFGSALNGTHLAVLQKTRVRKFLKAVYNAVESTNLLPPVNQG